MKNLLFIFILFPTLLPAQWQPANGPYGGMVWDMKSNEQAVFATQSNGVFRTFDGGQHWAKCDTARVHHLIVYRQQVMLLSYDHYFMRRSQDGGNTWTTRLLPDNIRFIRDWAEKDSIILIAANKNLWRSTDGGNTWAAKPIPGAAGDTYDAVEIIHNRFYVANQFQIFHSDDGLNWQALTSVPEPLPFLSVFQLYGQADTLLAFTGPRLFRSGDGGLSWTPAVVPSGTLGPLPPNFARYKNNWYAASGSLLVSRDAGLSWQMANGQSSAVADLWAAAAAGDTVLCGSQTKGVFQTRGDGFVPANRGLTGSMVSDVAFAADTLLAWDAQGISRTTGPLFAWDTAHLYATPLSGAPFSDLKVHRGRLFARQSGGHLMRSTDGGKSWQIATPPGAMPEDIHFQLEHHGDTLFFLESAGTLWYTTDDGTIWKAATVPGAVTALAVQNKTVFAVADSKIYRAANGVSTWVPLSSGPAGGISRIFATPDFLLSLVPGTVPLLFVSADAGQSWQPCAITWPPAFQGVQGQKVSIFQAGTVLIGAFERGGVWVSRDNGLHWAAFNKGLPASGKITEIAEHPRWFAAATGEGVFFIEKSQLQILAATASFFKDEMAVYPNPVGDVLNIDPKNGPPIQRISITDLRGQILLQKNREENISEVWTIPVHTLPPGFYFLQIKQEGGEGKVSAIYVAR